MVIDIGVKERVYLINHVEARNEHEAKTCKIVEAR